VALVGRVDEFLGDRHALLRQERGGWNSLTGLLKQANGILGLRSRCALSPGYHMAGFQPF